MSHVYKLNFLKSNTALLQLRSLPPGPVSRFQDTIDGVGIAVLWHPGIQAVSHCVSHCPVVGGMSRQCRVSGVPSWATKSMRACVWLEVISCRAGCPCNLSRKQGCLSVPQAPTRGKRSPCLQLHLSIPVAKGGKIQLNTPGRRRLWTVRLFSFFPIVSENPSDHHSL